MESDAFERQIASKNAENCWMKWKGSEVTQLCVHQFSLFSCEFHLLYSIDDRKKEKSCFSTQHFWNTTTERGWSAAVAFGLLRIIDEAQNILGFASQLARIPHLESLNNPVWTMDRRWKWESKRQRARRKHETHSPEPRKEAEKWQKGLKKKNKGIQTLYKTVES